ncbi:hypothetical protein CYL18_01700 [Pradoshia eiseniae]|uniref:Uncharacterized protein n=1 Tax=Pradoshia eiseniae TaxID=2064768 RepID=A0A2S7N3S1_9BACI|nr:hypothetical protein [Pradoshia eiseniae]PQD96635.1 hypothetical protein CYL18_01700 [Pradoshia eiseniae]
MGKGWESSEKAHPNPRQRGKGWAKDGNRQRRPTLTPVKRGKGGLRVGNSSTHARFHENQPRKKTKPAKSTILADLAG